jgi:phosphotransferase system enzyme I (PtsI)
MYEEFHPAVLRLIKEIIEAGHREETPVTVCGELGGNPLATVLLVGMGIDELSVATSRLLPVKQTIRNLTMTEAERVARAVLSMRTAQYIRMYLNDWRAENERDQQSAQSKPPVRSESNEE